MKLSVCRGRVEMYLPCGQRVLLPLCRPDGDADAHASCAAIRAKAKIHERRICAMLPVNNHLSARVAPSGPQAPTTQGSLVLTLSFFPVVLA